MFVSPLNKANPPPPSVRLSNYLEIIIAFSSSPPLITQGSKDIYDTFSL